MPNLNKILLNFALNILVFSTVLFSNPVKAVAGSFGLKVTDHVLGVKFTSTTSSSQTLFLEGLSDQNKNNYVISLGLHSKAYANEPRASGLGLTIKANALHVDSIISTPIGLSLGADYTMFFRTRAPIFVQTGANYSSNVLISKAGRMIDVFFILGYEVLPNTIISLEGREISADFDDGYEEYVVSSVLFSLAVAY